MPNVTDQKELNDLPVVTELSPTYDLLGIDPGANGSSIITVANFLAQTLKHVVEEGTIHMTDEEQDPGTTVLAVLRDLKESIDGLTTAIQSTGLGGYGTVWTNTVSLKTLNRLRNGGTSLVYADNSNTITGAPAYIKNLSTTFVAYRTEYSAAAEGEDPSWGLVELHELVPVKGRTWGAVRPNCSGHDKTGADHGSCRDLRQVLYQDPACHRRALFWILRCRHGIRLRVCYQHNADRVYLPFLPRGRQHQQITKRQLGSFWRVRYDSSTGHRDLSAEWDIPGHWRRRIRDRE